MTLYLDEVQTVPGWEGLVRRLRWTRAASSCSSRAPRPNCSPARWRRACAAARWRCSSTPSASARRCVTLGASRPSRLSASAPRTARRWISDFGATSPRGDSQRRRALHLVTAPPCWAGYVDVVVLRDVIERHAVSNPLALRWIERQLLANPGGSFSVKKHYDTLRSQGVAVGKDTLHDYLAHLEDAFLVRTVAMHSASERQRMVNPRKAYPVDPGLIALFERSGRTHHGRALETAILLELERRGYRRRLRAHRGGLRGGFPRASRRRRAVAGAGALESEGDETWERELRALEAAAGTHPDARAFLVTLDAVAPSRPMPDGLTWAPAARWLLEEM